MSLKHKGTKNYKEQGITLIALVVTIITLLILAGVSINLVLGSNGVIERAKYATNTWTSATINESTMMEQIEDEISNLTIGHISQNGVDHSEVLQQYFSNPNCWEEVTEGVWRLGNNTELGVNGDNLISILTENGYYYYYYLGSVYKVPYDEEIGYEVTRIDTNFDINRFGEYIVDGYDVLNVPDKDVYNRTSSRNLIPIGEYFAATEYEELYFQDEFGDIDYNRPFIGYIVNAWGPEDDPFNSETIYYDINGNIITDPLRCTKPA